MRTQTEIGLVTAYRKSKSTTTTRKGFGLMLGERLRDRWVTPGTQEVRLELEGVKEVLPVRLRKGFWNQCPEFLHDEIIDWFDSQGLAIPWPNRKPYEFAMERFSGTHFRVRRHGR